MCRPLHAKCPIELFVRDVLDRLLVLLIGGIVDDDIQPAKGLDRALDVRFDSMPGLVDAGVEKAVVGALSYEP